MNTKKFTIGAALLALVLGVGCERKPTAPAMPATTLTTQGQASQPKVAGTNYRLDDKSDFPTNPLATSIENHEAKVSAYVGRTGKKLIVGEVKFPSRSDLESYVDREDLLSKTGAMLSDGTTLITIASKEPKVLSLQEGVDLQSFILGYQAKTGMEFFQPKYFFQPDELPSSVMGRRIIERKKIEGLDCQYAGFYHNSDMEDKIVKKKAFVGSGPYWEVQKEVNDAIVIAQCVFDKQLSKTELNEVKQDDSLARYSYFFKDGKTIVIEASVNLNRNEMEDVLKGLKKYYDRIGLNKGPLNKDLFEIFPAYREYFTPW